MLTSKTSLASPEIRVKFDPGIRWSEYEIQRFLLAGRADIWACATLGPSQFSTLDHCCGHLVESGNYDLLHALPD